MDTSDDTITGKTKVSAVHIFYREDGPSIVTEDDFKFSKPDKFKQNNMNE
jgi:hypothetical protein